MDGELNGTTESEALKVRTFEELEKDAEEQQNKLTFSWKLKPRMPSYREEYDRHCFTHFPYRSFVHRKWIQAEKNIAHTKDPVRSRNICFHYRLHVPQWQGQLHKPSVGQHGE